MLKKQLRREIAGRLAALSREAIHKSSIQATHIVSELEVFRKSTTIGIYMHMDNEMETSHLTNLAFNNSKRVFLPRIENLATFDDYKRFPAQKQCLHFLEVETQAQVEALPVRGKYAIREPDYTAERTNDLLYTNTQMDIMFLPAVAYTKHGARLGHGAGFYDDFIKRYRKQFGKTPLLIGIGLPEQLVEDGQIQMEDHDEPLDFVILGNSVYTRNQTW